MSERPAAAFKAIPDWRLAARVLGYGTQVFAVADTEIRKLKRDPSEVLTRALQPAVWLLLFGQVMALCAALMPAAATTLISWRRAY